MHKGLLAEMADGSAAPAATGYWRVIQAVLLFTALFVCYAIRVFLSVAITDIGQQFGYSNVQKGTILSAFFGGYLCLQLVAGYASTKFGGKPVIAAGVLLSSLLTALTPPFAGNLAALVALRVVVGLTQSVAYPTVHALMSAWSPRTERSRLVGFVWSGAYIGTAATLPLAGAICNRSLSWTMLQGWQSGFYLLGVLGSAWTLVWWLLGGSSPETHRWISAEERAYILAHRDPPAHISLRSVPWARLFTHRTVLASAAAHFAHNWAFYMCLTWLPEYLNQQLGLNVEEGSSLLTLPYLACFLFSTGGGQVADAAMKKGMPILRVRRLAHTLGELVPAATLVAAGYAHSQALVVAMLVLCTGFSGCSMSSYACTPLDIAPQYAGLLMGLSNTIATIPGIIAPLIVGAMVSPPHNDAAGWQGAFWLSSAVTVAGWAVYVTFVQAHALPELAERKGSEDIDDGQQDAKSTAAVAVAVVAVTGAASGSIPTASSASINSQTAEVAGDAIEEADDDVERVQLLVQEKSGRR